MVHHPSWSVPTDKHNYCDCAGGGGAGGPWYRSYDGKPPPAEFQTPEFVTYAGLSLPKRAKDADYYYSKAAGSLIWCVVHLF